MDPPHSGADGRMGGVIISGIAGPVAGDVVGRDKITFNLGLSPEAETKLENLMACLSGRADARRNLAVRWIVEIMSAVFVDEMRMLYVVASTVARHANMDRYSEFVALSELHIDDLKNLLGRYNSDLEIAVISELRAIEQRQLWTLNRLKSGHIILSQENKMFREMRSTSQRMHQLFSTVQIPGYDATAEMIEQMGEHIWGDRPRATGSIDMLFRLRLAVQSAYLARVQEGVNAPILSIADDIHQSFALAYFLVDRWVLDEGLSEQ
jgi:hypothetical protein